MANDTYLTYTEYQTLGGTVVTSSSAFTPLEFKARKKIDWLTDSRVKNMAAVPSAVKLCMVSIINMLSSVGSEAQANKPQVSSFSTDGYSETRGSLLSAADADANMNAIIRESLYGETDDNGTPLLYRGVY